MGSETVDSTSLTGVSFTSTGPSWESTTSYLVGTVIVREF